MFDTVQPIELLWTVIAVLGLVYSVFNFYVAFRTIHFLRKAGQSHVLPDWRVARFTQMTETFRFIMQCIFVTIGVLAMTIPNTPTPHLPLRYQIFTFVFKWGLVTVASLTGMQSFNAWRVRRYFAELTMYSHLKGEKGDTGDPGEVGEQGRQGNQGNQGFRGRPGKDSVN